MFVILFIIYININNDEIYIDIIKFKKGNYIY